MKLYNTLTKKIEDIKPKSENKLNYFVCGPTVYDLSHIGHAKTYVQFDVIARVLRRQGFDVFYLQNITDIDDKIIARAKEKGVSWDDISAKYENEYYTDMKLLNNTSVSKYAKATDYIPQIIKQVRVLLDKGHAYKIDDGVYFEVATFKEYGKLSGRQEIKEDDAQSRIDESDQKRGWNDFCLWKFSKPGEPSWDSPFGSGRPGWHIEDTAITEHFFGPQYELHGGAIDLIFPHHEAEITQMESISGKVPFVSHWVHTGFLNIDSAKMSKSKGNFFTIREVIEKKYDPMALRLLVLQSHYRSAINFSWELLDAAQNRLNNLRAMSDLLWQPVSKRKNSALFDTKPIIDALTDDLDTPKALAALSSVEHKVNDDLIHQQDTKAFKDYLKFVDEVLGLNLSETRDITDAQKTLIKKREGARANIDWESADRFRDELAKDGIHLRDTEFGTVWFRI